jgi:hypothetical protein
VIGERAISDTASHERTRTKGQWADARPPNSSGDAPIEWLERLKGRMGTHSRVPRMLAPGAHHANVIEVTVYRHRVRLFALRARDGNEHLAGVARVSLAPHRAARGHVSTGPAAGRARRAVRALRLRSSTTPVLPAIPTRPVFSTSSAVSAARVKCRISVISPSLGSDDWPREYSVRTKHVSL